MQSIILTSGTIFAGNPITFRVTPSHISGDNISFHRIIIKVIASMLVDNEQVIPPTEIDMSVSLYNEEPQTIDVSSSLRAILDSYEYRPELSIYPIVKWRVECWDEYMQDGVVIPKYKPMEYPPKVKGIENSDHLYCIAGSVPDAQRIFALPLPFMKSLSDKPSSVQLFPINKGYVFTPDLPKDVSLPTSYILESLESDEKVSTTSGEKTINNRHVYVLPEDESANRVVFRFINRYGVMECISTPRAASIDVNMESQEYADATTEMFNQVHRGIVVKKNNRETLKFSTDPLDEQWVHWYIHEFFMAKHVWMEIPYDGYSQFVRCHILTDDTINAIDRTSANQLALKFNVKPDINGHI